VSNVFVRLVNIATFQMGECYVDSVMNHLFNNPTGKLSIKMLHRSSKSLIRALIRFKSNVRFEAWFTDCDEFRLL
jgi:hypothetical protein